MEVKKPKAKPRKVCLPWPAVVSTRRSLLFLLAISVFLFGSQFVLSYITYNSHTDVQTNVEKTFSVRQDALERRIRMIESTRESSVREINSTVREIGEGKNGSDAIIDHGAQFDVDKIIGSVVEIICLDNNNRDVFYTGSGTMVDKSGLVLTNRHLLVSKDDSLIMFCGIGFTSDPQEPPRTEFITETVAVDKDADLALLHVIDHIEGEEIPKHFEAVSMQNARLASEGLRLGDTVYIAGYPGIGAKTFTFTQGVISGRVGDKLIKTSALIDSGTSGGAVFDASGQYVGMPTAAARGDIGGSLGYLIGANTVDDFMREFYAGDLTESILN